MRYSQRSIFLFWAPLAATWIMMASEGPFLAAVIARLPDATFNLAAYGVAVALAIVVEAPVIMLMSAATSVVRDRVSFVKLRNFTRALNGGTTLVLLVLLVPSVFDALTGSLMGLPPEVAARTYGSLWFLLPWPGAIGYRRFVQGVLIRSGKTKLVAYGTVIRLAGMAAAALVGFFLLDIPGAWVGTLALATGVCVEAAAARLMAARTIRALLSGAHDPPGPPRTVRYREVAAFYFPLALTSLIGLMVHPMLTFFMGRSISPVESLAVFPVVHSLSFVFRSMGLAFQDASIALLGERFEHLPELERFGTMLGLATSSGLALVTFTPLSRFWFETVSGLTSELTAFALTPAQLAVPLPALSVLLSLQRAILVEARTTRHITVASALEVTAIAGTFVLLAFGFETVGATAAFGAFLVGRLTSNSYLVGGCRTVVRRVKAGAFAEAVDGPDAARAAASAPE